MGDGEEFENISGATTHTYTNSGEYIIKITGKYPRFYLRDCDSNKLLQVIQWGTQVWESMKYTLYQASYVNGEIKDTPNLSEVTDMHNMFTEAISFNEPLNDWNVSNVTDMRSMFNNASAFTNHDLSSWNVSNVPNNSEYKGDFMTGSGSDNTEPIWQ